MTLESFFSSKYLIENQKSKTKNVEKHSFGSLFTSGRFLYYFYENVDNTISGQKLTKKTVHWLGSVYSYNLYTVVIIPLVGDHDGEEDRSNEDDVVDWE